MSFVMLPSRVFHNIMTHHPSTGGNITRIIPLTFLEYDVAHAAENYRRSPSSTVSSRAFNQPGRGDETNFDCDVLRIC